MTFLKPAITAATMMPNVLKLGPKMSRKKLTAEFQRPITKLHTTVMPAWINVHTICASAPNAALAGPKMLLRKFTATCQAAITITTAAEMNAEMPAHAGSTTLCQNHMNTGPATSLTNKYI